jgi:XRE family transcriptional regulator, regulator of sulfur utilization
MTELNAPRIGPLRQRQRKAPGLRLQQLAVLSRIERSEANPTFAVLWSLTMIAS